MSARETSATFSSAAGSIGTPSLAAMAAMRLAMSAAGARWKRMSTQ